MIENIWRDSQCRDQDRAPLYALGDEGEVVRVYKHDPDCPHVQDNQLCEDGSIDLE